MIYLLYVYTEYNVQSLNNYFLYYSNNKVEKGVRVEINFRNRNIIGFVLNVEEKENLNDYSFEIKKINKIIDEVSILNEKYLELSKIISDYYYYPLIGVLFTILPKSIRPVSSYINAPKISYNTYYFLKDLKYLPKNKNEEKILNRFSNSNYILKKDISESKTLIKLIENNIIEIKKEEKYRYSFNKTYNYEKNIILSNNQKEAYLNILNSNKKVSLLKGVTGSGKTEIYIKLIENVLNEGKNVILLVPEVALTPLMISRILSYFNIEIAILHSSLTNAERYDEFRKIKNNKIRIVIGTRSAIFAPINNLGLIIVDEEHDSSYKQEENLCYNAKDIAYLRLKIDPNIKIVLGSATPSLESLNKAKKGIFNLVELNEKYFNNYKTNVSLIDLKDNNEFTKSKIFSNTLINKINDVVLKNKQVLILVNNRGYSYYTYCEKCGFTYKCPTCNLNLIYHKNNNLLMCHHCDYKIKLNKCPICGSNNFIHYGLGIEKVEEEFKKIFPNFKYLILNSDITSTLKEIENVLDKFNNKESNVLIGTQIISKGHDFKECDLVAIINIDNLLNLSTYKSNEEAFDIITQTLGRTGRQFQGEGIIQTNDITNKIINFAINNDYDSFYNYEIQRRKKYNYPPFTNLIEIGFESNLYKNVSYYSSFFKERFEEIFKDSIIEGPSYIFKYKNGFKNSLFIKIKDIKQIKDDLIYLIKKFNDKKDIKISINFSPFDL